MHLYVFFSADEIDDLVHHFILANDKEGLAKLSFAVSNADDLFCSFAVGVGGHPIYHGQGEGAIEIPVDHSERIPAIREEYCDLAGHVSVGVGKDLVQAQRACIWAKAHGGDQIVLYTPEMESQLLDMTGDLSKAEIESLPIHIKESSSSSDSDSESGSKSKSNTKSEETDADSSAGSSGSDSDNNENEASDNSKEKIKQVAVEVLKQVKDNAQTIEALKEKDPNAYESIRAVIEVMLMMADSFANGGESSGDTEPNKGLDKETESSELHKAEVHQFKRRFHKKARIKFPRGSSSKGGRVPVGSIRAGKIKVQFSDGSYKWVSVAEAAKLRGHSVKKAEEDLEKAIRKLYIGTAKRTKPKTLAAKMKTLKLPKSVSQPKVKVPKK